MVHITGEDTTAVYSVGGDNGVMRITAKEVTWENLVSLLEWRPLN
jgi:hypothetical protein